MRIQQEQQHLPRISNCCAGRARALAAACSAASGRALWRVHHCRGSGGHVGPPPHRASGGTGHSSPHKVRVPACFTAEVLLLLQSVCHQGGLTLLPKCAATSTKMTLQ
jgi:hypothetical protein